MHSQTTRSDLNDLTYLMNQKYRELVQWANNNGAFINPSCEFHAVPGEGGTMSAKIGSQVIEPHSILLRIPYCLTLSYLNAIAAGKKGSHYVPRSRPLPEALLQSTADHDTIGTIFLMQQYLLGSESFWYP